MRASAAVALLLSSPCLYASGSFSSQQGSPFAPPQASMHYAPDRTCDLQHIRVDIDVDYPSRTFIGHVENTLSPLRDGITTVILNAGPTLQISNLSVDGVKAKYERKDRDLLISTPPLHRGKRIVISMDYKSVGSRDGGGGGFHWIASSPSQPNRVGFWTQGETASNSNWAPTWDYPNDMTTSETHTTVPADWTVVGNGVQTSNTLSSDRKKRTFVWTMNLPHATYLLSIVGGPFDVTHDSWRGVPLWYVVPKGEGIYSAYTHSGTKDMLSFYSDVLGVKYAWPKYAQDAMFDFGGGMENVSATTMGENALTEPREGFRRSDSLISHEMAHQWFGDLVTCMDWGDIWLNESFATFMQMMYFEHSRGKNSYDREVDNNTRSYLGEAQRYKRAISTKMYANPDRMFDSHTYPKGGVVLHTLRRQLGDAAFFRGLNLYLTTYRHTPVQTAQLCRALTDSSGIDCQPFFDQWILKPGHPVLDYSWTWDDTEKAAVLTVKQIQNTSDGTPIYNIPAKVGIIVGSKFRRVPVLLNAASQEIKIPMSPRPDALLLDPDHDFLRQIPELYWTRAELVAIMQYAPEGADRTEAMRRLMEANPSDAEVKLAGDLVAKDRDFVPSFTSIASLANLQRPDLRPVFESLLNHPDFSRRVEAVNALSKLPADPGTTEKLRALINDHSPIFVVTSCIGALSVWDAKANLDVFKKALSIGSKSGAIQRAAERAIEAAK